MPPKKSQNSVITDSVERVEKFEPTFTRELTKVEKSYIENNLSIALADLAADLGVPEVKVEEYVETLKSKEPTQFQRNIATKQHGNSQVSIMTDGASQVIDAAYEQHKKKDPKYVFKPKRS